MPGKAKKQFRSTASKSRNASDNACRTEEILNGSTEDCWSLQMSAGLFILIFGIYAYTAYPSVPGGDSGELLSAACELGVAHPPGYPLWTLMSALTVRLLPFTAAYSVNLLTCAISALASVTVFFSCQQLTHSLTTSAVAAVIFSFSPLTWTWAVTAEVFALNNLFTALLIATLVKFELSSLGEQRRNAVYIGALLSGLAMTNQHTIILYIPAIACRVVFKLIKLKEMNTALAFSVVALGGLGLTPYTYVFISSYKNTARWSWGDQTTLPGFLSHFLREEYGSFNLGKGGAHPGFVVNLVEYKRSLLHELTQAGYTLACIGIVQVFIDSNEGIRRVTQTLLVSLVSYVTFFCWRANLDITTELMREVVERFWLQTNIIWTILLAMGCKLLYVRLNLKMSISFIIKMSAFAAVTALCLARSWQHCNHHTDTVVRDFSHSIISSFPNNSLVLTKGDLPSGTLRYMQFCEGKRTDITLIEQELMSYAWYIPKMSHLVPSVTFPGHRWHKVVGKTIDGLLIFNMLNFLDANIDSRPIFVCIGMQDKESSWTSKYHLIPYGPCHQVVRAEAEWVAHTHPYHDTWELSYSKLREGSWENIANEEMWNAKISRALFLYNSASQSADETVMFRLFSQSYQEYNVILNTHTAAPDYFHKNYALACEKMARSPNLPPSQIKGHVLEAIKHFKLYVASGAEDEQMPAIHRVIESLETQLA